jgi:hypothetical protein
MIRLASPISFAMIEALMFISPELFSYWVFIRAKPQPSPEQPPNRVGHASCFRPGVMETGQ